MRQLALVSVLSLSGACYQGVDALGDDVASTRDEEFNSEVLNGPVLQGTVLQGTVLQGVVLQGPVLQGPVLQGPVLQGPVLQGPVLQGVVLQGPVLQGPVLQGPTLNGSEFTGKVKKNNKWVTAKRDDFIGSEWEVRVGQVVDGVESVETYILRIDDINQSEEQDDVYLYDVVQRPKAGGEWKPLCADSEGNLIPAVPMANYWNLTTGDRVDDDNVFVFACTNAVLAKCALWGYRPWATATRCKDDKKKGKKCEQISLRDHHQACTRMARADYCGDGQPWTVTGTAIDVWDRLSPQIEASTTDWFTEAEWNPDGAYCLNDIRHQEFKEQGLYPTCFLDKKGKPKKFNDCGSMEKHRSLLASSFDKPGSNEGDNCGKGGKHGHHGHHGHGHHHHNH